MSKKSAGTSRPRLAIVLGLAATMVVVVLHLSGGGARLELQALDFRFRHLSTAPPNDRIVHIDIDDRSLEELGRWPWPRAQLAGIVDVLRRAGAAAVALDVIMPEPQETRYVSPETELYSAGFGRFIGNPSPRAVFDDKILQDTLREYRRVFVPLHIDLSPARPTPLEARLQRLLEDEPGLGPEQLAAAGELSAPLKPGVFHRVMRRALEARARRFLRERRGVSLEALVRAVLPGESDRARTEQLDIVRRAYLRFRGLRAIRRFALAGERIGRYPAQIGRITPPLAGLAELCYGSGFVTFDPDADGVVRHIPLLAGDDEGLYPQFALALAAYELARSHGGAYTISADASSVTLRFADGFERPLPVDTRGYLLINWIRPDRANAAPMHVSATRIGGAWTLQESLKRNRDLRRLLHLWLLGMARRFRTQEIKDLYWRIVELDQKVNEVHQQLVAAQAERQRALLFDPGDVPPPPKQLQAQQDMLEAELDALCANLRTELRDPEHLAVFLGGPRAPATAPAANSTDAAEPKRRGAQELARFNKELAEARFFMDQLDLADRSNAKIRRDLSEQIESIRRMVGGKLCMVGSTASGAADFVPTPVHKRTPGVVVHSNILNTIYSGAIVRKAHAALDIGAILLAGLIVALLTASRPVWLAGPGTVILAGAYAAVNALVIFGVLGVWLVFWAPMFAMAGAFAVVTAYRQLTEERAKRRIREMFAHALSPALVDRLVEDPSLAKLGGERRELTFFFSDLQGFTPLSERLGEAQTVRLLNRYFDRMTDVIQNRRGGYLNKFLGDGLFVFFGAPVFQEDHAARALLAAVDCQEEVRLLSGQLVEELGDHVRLTCRIGISTGEVMVGNCGSSQRMDYTAIGDPVNLASRLEAANKFFGTRILVSDEAYRRGRDDSLLARPLGPVTVVGKVEPVAVWHLAGAGEQADAKLKDAFAAFAEAISLFAGSRFAEAASLFEDVRRMLPDDRPTEIFLELSRNYQANPPADDWDGSLRLTEK